ASDDVPAQLRSADLFVSASRAEGLPGAVIEAMLTGLPVVLSDIGVHREMIEDGTSGRLFPAGDGVALAALIVALLERPGEMRRLGERARERARELFDLEQVAARHAQLYADVLGAWRARGTA
ncbi:MAG TPA: glycosyltransferase family 4 protein, partial [Candidatus Methanoperedens sp.]|nr:glycosyltransferase family 4 protein [Candidatus Methanoperedens sp.]